MFECQFDVNYFFENVQVVQVTAGRKLIKNDIAGVCNKRFMRSFCVTNYKIVLLLSKEVATIKHKKTWKCCVA